jgi:hypothetical protein
MSGVVLEERFEQWRQEASPKEILDANALVNEHLQILKNESSRNSKGTDTNLILEQTVQISLIDALSTEARKYLQEVAKKGSFSVKDKEYVGVIGTIGRELGELSSLAQKDYNASIPRPKFNKNKFIETLSSDIFPLPDFIDYFYNLQRARYELRSTDVGLDYLMFEDNTQRSDIHEFVENCLEFFRIYDVRGSIGFLSYIDKHFDGVTILNDEDYIEYLESGNQDYCILEKTYSGQTVSDLKYLLSELDDAFREVIKNRAPKGTIPLYSNEIIFDENQNSEYSEQEIAPFIVDIYYCDKDEHSEIFGHTYTETDSELVKELLTMYHLSENNMEGIGKLNTRKITDAAIWNQYRLNLINRIGEQESENESNTHRRMSVDQFVNQFVESQARRIVLDPHEEEYVSSTLRRLDNQTMLEIYDEQLLWDLDLKK